MSNHARRSCRIIEYSYSEQTLRSGLPVVRRFSLGAGTGGHRSRAF